MLHMLFVGTLQTAIIGMFKTLLWDLA